MSGKAKPVGSLGQLEHWGAKLCVLQKTLQPAITRGVALIFAADHGVAAEEKVTSYPSSVTEAIFATLAAGGAAASVLAKSQGVELELVDVGIDADVDYTKGLAEVNGTIRVLTNKVCRGTRNFCKGPAMTMAECKAAMTVGKAAVTRQLTPGHLGGLTATAFIFGEVGIGNTTASAALLCALRGCLAVDAVGQGAGLDPDGMARKREVVDRALRVHHDVIAALHAVHLRRHPNECIVEPADEDVVVAALAAVGGLEIAAMVGAMVEAAAQGAPILLDGFICTVAAMVAATLSPSCAAHFFPSTRSPERGFELASSWLRDLDTPSAEGSVPWDPVLSSQPLFDAGLRLGEGTGAILAFSFLRAAASVAAEMWTLDEAVQCVKQHSSVQH
eukprot:GGOE01002711.1.p1 GENE.GGOE01002711.1~~GGOE01002711.1.p1  ORF type:complete len:407 (-),score=83.27 GGOE01002711.1:188-1354(-)